MRGSVFKRSKSWAFAVEVSRDENGTRTRHQKAGFKTKKDAQAAMHEVLHRLGSGEYVAPANLTLASYLRNQWLPAIRASVRPSTFESYRMTVEKHIALTIGGTKLQAVTPAKLNALYADLLAKGRSDGKGGLSPKSVRNCHVIIRKALGDAVRWSLIARNPAAFAEPPKLTQAGDRTMMTWTPQQARSFLQALSDDRLYAAWLLALSTGMRRGEILGLRWSDTDLETGKLAIRQTLITVNYEIQFSTPKTSRGRRSIALDKTTANVLRAHRKAQLEERMAIGATRYIDNDLVFCRLDGSPMHPDLFSQTFDRAVAKSGLPRIRLHDLRHTYATISLEAGVHPKVVSERLGHATVAFTLDRYSHAVPGMQEDAAEKVAALILGSDG
ncbi:MAG: tyrosine-type recombinase/integrase [Actinobacteria bacterium]|nr:tyrosine-type recombinase/integrase [Actinomycetota bacterium]